LLKLDMITTTQIPDNINIKPIKAVFCSLRSYEFNHSCRRLQYYSTIATVGYKVVKIGRASRIVAYLTFIMIIGTTRGIIKI